MNLANFSLNNLIVHLSNVIEYELFYVQNWINKKVDTDI